jgi:hypothetical protein
MQYLLQREGHFVYCTDLPTWPMDDGEAEVHSRVMNTLISNVKGNSLKLLKRYRDPHEAGMT